MFTHDILFLFSLLFHLSMYIDYNNCVFQFYFESKGRILFF